MEFVLIDWTRMGKTFCVAGLVAEGGAWRTVRPMPVALRPTPHIGVGTQKTESGSLPSVPRNVGWLPRQLELFARWDILELLDPQPAEVERPHTEDMWVRLLRPTGRSIATERRAALLREMCTQAASPRFGAQLLTTAMSAYLKPGSGDRSLTTIILPSGEISFEASARGGATDVDVRARLNLPGLGTKLVPVKDHHLLRHGELSATDPAGLARVLRETVAAMGPSVAVRLGLSRGFVSGHGEPRCWLMADGFFPAEDISS
jgi:hypothetical protein